MSRIENPSRLNPPPSSGGVAIRASHALSTLIPREPTGKSRRVTSRVYCKTMLPEPHYLLASKPRKDPSVFTDVLGIRKVPGPIAGDNRHNCTIRDCFVFPMLCLTLQIGATCVRHWFLALLFSPCLLLYISNQLFFVRTIHEFCPPPPPHEQETPKGRWERGSGEKATETARQSHNTKRI